MSVVKSSLKKLVDQQDLSFEEARQAFSEIMTGQCSEPLIAAWLTASMMKGESSDEIAAGIEIMRENVLQIPCNDKNAVDIVGTGGDGLGTYNISTASVFVTAGAGVTVAKHGNRALSSKSGSADVLSSLGINTNCTAEKMAQCLEDINLSFMFAPLLHPAMKYAIGPRREMGIRTIFNLLGPMTNPAGVRRGLFGVFNADFTRSLAKAAAKLGADHMLFAHGLDGLDEISVCDKTLIVEVKGNEVTEYEISPEDFGLKRHKIEDLLGGTPEENAIALRNVLKGEKNAYRDAVIINAAAGIYTAGKTNTLAEAIPLAEQSIDSGAALIKLDELCSHTNS